MQIYELGYLILPSIAEGELGSAVDKIKAVIAKANGVELEGEMPFKHNLSYAMSKTVGASRYVVSDAYIGWIKFELEPVETGMLQTEMAKIEEVLRFLLLKTPRETTFTFAKAKAALAEKAAALEAVQDEVEAVLPAEEVIPVVE